MSSFLRNGSVCTGAIEGESLRCGRGESVASRISAGRPEYPERRSRGLRGPFRACLGRIRLMRRALLATAILFCAPCIVRAGTRNVALGRSRRIQPLGAFVKSFHGATATLSPAARGLSVVWTLTNNGKAVVYVAGGCSPAQLDMRAATGQGVRPTGCPGELGHVEPVAPGRIFRVVIRLRRYLQVPTHGTFKVDYWNSVWDRKAAHEFMQSPGKLDLGLFLARDVVNLQPNALVVKIGADGKLAWSKPGGGAAPKAINVSPAPPHVGKSALPTSGPIAALAAVADAVRRADVKAAGQLVDRTPAGRLILAEIPLAGAINRFCRVVRQRLAFDPAPHLAAAFPSVDELDNTLTRLDLKSLKVRGDRASVAIWVINRARIKWVPGLTLRLRRVKGRWLYSGAAGFHLTEPQLRREQKFDRRVTEIFRALTIRVREGKIKTLADLDLISAAQLGRVNEWYARRPKVAHQR